MHRIGKARRRSLALAIAALAATAAAAPAAQAGDVTLKIVNARAAVGFVKGAPIAPGTPYKAIINVDDSGDPSNAVDPRCGFAPGVALDYTQYPESCPWPSLSGMNPGIGPVQNLIWHGDQDGLNTTTAVTLPAGKYLISALVDGYRLDGVHVVVPATGSVQAVLEAQPEPLPLATVRMDVFEDNAPSNGQFDLEPESGLAGFTGHIAEVAGEVTTDYFGNPLCTNYVDSTPGDGVPDLVDGVPTIDPQNPGGTCLSDAEGHIVIPFLGPGRYAGSAEPPADQAANWIQTSTLEGRHDWDSWVQEGATGFDVEMVNGVESQAFVPLGFVRVRRGPALTQAQIDSGATGRVSTSPQAVGSVKGTVVSALSYTPDPDYGITIGDDGEQYGQVQDGTVPNAWIAIGDIGNGDQTIYVGQADDQGRFDIRGLRPGEYNITFWDEEQVHILHMEQLTIPDATPVEMDTIMLAQWFGQVEGFVFNDDNENGHRDPGESGVAGQAVVLRSRDNSERDGGDVTAITDIFGHYELRAAYPLVQWVVMEAYNDRYRATGYTYRTFNESTEHVVDEPGVVDIGATHIIGQKSFVDWGFKAYQPGENGGIVGTVSYGTTRNELDPAELAIEPWQVGLPGATVTLFEAVQQPDGSWQKGAQLDQTTTELWHRPTGCDPRDAWGDPVLFPFNSVTEPNGTEHECVEGLGGGQQVENLKGKGNATVNGNYGFEAAPGDYIVEVTMPDDLSGAPAFKPTREEDINVFAGTALTPQVQRIECAGPLHTVDVAGVGADGPDATVNPTFAGEGGSPYEGQQKPLCSAKLVHVDDQRSVAPSFEYFTDVPIPGRMWGLIIDDLTMSTDKREILFGDKLGLANIPVGFYDYTGKPYEITQTDRNGYYEVLLPSTTNINCPTPSGVCPNVVRVVGNDPGSAEHPNPGYDPTHKVMSANWQISPGQYAQSDLAPFSNAAQVIAPGAQLAHAAKCELDGGIPQLFAVNDVVFNTNQGGQQLVIKGRGFGAGASSPVTARVELQGPSGGPTSVNWNASGVTWTDTQITLNLPSVSNSQAGPRNLRIVRADGRGSINGITVHYVSSQNGNNPYVRPSRVFRVGPGRPYATIQAAINAAAGYTGVPDGAVEDGWDGQLERAIVAVYPGTPGQWNPQGSYRENVIVPGALKLQGVGPGGFRADGSFVQGTDIDASTWSAAEDETWWGLMQDFAPVAASPVADGAVVTVVGRQGAFNSTSFRGQIDGIHLRGGESLGLPNTINPLGGGPAPNPQGVQGALSQGGGVFLLGGQRNFQVTNNVIQGNGGSYGGAIRLGAPNVGTNDLGNVDILDNQILQNGGTTKAGAIAVFNGSDDYEIRRNEICGNFSAEYGGGISVYGRSPNGQIAQNRIYFNASYDEGAGIFVGGELPNDPDLPSDGTGTQTITGNIVQANISNDDGAGIRLLMVMNSRINVTNNMLVNNVATHEGAGIALDDAPDVLFAGNTVMKNITTATAMTSDGRPAPTGLSMTANSEQLQAAAGIGPFTPPRIVNSVFWDNRAGSWDGVGDAVVRGIGLAGDPTPIEHWDVGMADASYGTMPVTNSVLQSTNGVTPSPTNVIQDPLVESPFDTTIFTAPFRGDPHFVGTTIVSLDVPPVRAGDYHLTSTSPAINRGANATALGQPTTDIDGQNRTTPWDIGADEYVAPPAPRFRAAQVGSALAVTASLGSTVQTHPTKRPPAGAAPVTYRSRCTTCTAKLAVRRTAGRTTRLIAMKRSHGRFSADVKGLRPGTYRVRVVVRYPGGVRAVSSWKTITVARRRAR